MSTSPWWRRYWRSLGFGREVGEELEFHVAMLTRDLIADGMAPDEAAREAARRFGNRRQVQGQLEQIERRRGTRLRAAVWLEEVWQDLKLGARGLLKRPAFTAAAVASLGLGIASATVVLSILDTWVLKPLPVDGPDDLVVIGSRTKALGRLVIPNVALPTVADLRAESDLFTDVGAWRIQSAAIRRPTSSQSAVGYLLAVTPNYFTMLGVRPALGRLFAAEDGRSRDPVIVLNHDYWSTRLGADRAMIGEALLLNGATFTIIGVLPPAFTGTETLIQPIGFIPTTAEERLDLALRDNETSRAIAFYQGLARRRPGVSMTQIHTRLDVVVGRIAREYPDLPEGYGLAAFPERQARPAMSAAEQMPVVVVMLTSLAALVLGTAAINVANLVLARASARKEELVVRLALGATRWRLVRQMLTESLLLGTMGFVGAALLARAMVGWISRFDIAMALPIHLGFETGTRVLTMSLVGSLAAGLLAGFGPALIATRDSIQASLRRGGRSGGSGGGRLRSVLLVAQVAAASVALVSAGFLTESARRAARLDLGMSPTGVSTTMLSAEQARLDSVSARVAFARIRQQIEVIPGVTGVAYTTGVPLSSSGWEVGDIYLDRENRAASARGAISIMSIATEPDFFSVLQVRLKAGRLFRPEDDTLGPRVAMVNETAAKFLWPGTDPLGQRFRQRPDGPPIEVVGVVADGRYFLIGEAPRPIVFRAFRQERGTFASLLVQSRLTPVEIEARVREAIGRIEPDLAPSRFDTMEGLIQNGLNGLLPLRAGAFLAGGIGVLVLLLAVVGLYGVLAFTVTQETREIGLRMALGAEPGRIVGRILGRGGRFVVAGLAIGVPIAIFLVGRLRGLLVGVSPLSLEVYLAVAIALLVITATAAYLPARRAARLDPVKALRTDG